MKERFLSYFRPSLRVSYAVVDGLTSAFSMFGAILSGWEGATGIKETDEQADAWLRYGTALGVAVVAGLIEGVSNYYFEGKVIVQEEEQGQEPPLDMSQAGSNIKAKGAESLYLISAMSLKIADNYFTASATKAWFTTLLDIGLSRVVKPLETWETLAVILYTVLVDMPFEMSNNWFEIAEKIQQKWGHAGPSYSRKLLAYLDQPLGRAWVASAGTLSHVTNHALGLFLCFPSQLLVGEEVSSLAWKAFIALNALNFLAMGVNLRQTYLFETAVSLKNIAEATGRSVILSEGSGQKGPCAFWCFKGRQKWAQRLWRTLLYTQGPYQGADNLMPVFLTLRHLLQPLKNQAQWAVVAPISSLTFVIATLGAHFSEVTAALKQLERRGSNRGSTPLLGHHSSELDSRSPGPEAVSCPMEA